MPEGVRSLVAARLNGVSTAIAVGRQNRYFGGRSGPHCGHPRMHVARAAQLEISVEHDVPLAVRFSRILTLLRNEGGTRVHQRMLY